MRAASWSDCRPGRGWHSAGTARLQRGGTRRATSGSSYEPGLVCPRFCGRCCPVTTDGSRDASQGSESQPASSHWPRARAWVAPGRRSGRRQGGSPVSWGPPEDQDRWASGARTVSLVGGHARWWGRRNPGREDTASWLDTIEGGDGRRGLVGPPVEQVGEGGS